MGILGRFGAGNPQAGGVASHVVAPVNQGPPVQPGGGRGGGFADRLRQKRRFAQRQQKLNQTSGPIGNIMLPSPPRFTRDAGSGPVVQGPTSLPPQFGGATVGGNVDPSLPQFGGGRPQPGFGPGGLQANPFSGPTRAFGRQSFGNKSI